MLAYTCPLEFAKNRPDALGLPNMGCCRGDQLVLGACPDDRPMLLSFLLK